MNKDNGGCRISADLFHILKDDAVKVLYSVWQKIGKVNNSHNTGKGQFSFLSQRRAMPNNAQTTVQLHSFHKLAR